MADREIELEFPIAGIDRAMPFQRQPPYTTPYALNVMPMAGTDGRYWGGSRCGFLPFQRPTDSDIVAPIIGMFHDSTHGMPCIAAHDDFDTPELGPAWSYAADSQRRLEWRRGAWHLAASPDTGPAVLLYNTMLLMIGAPESQTVMPRRMLAGFFIRFLPDRGRLHGLIHVDFPWVEAGIASGYPEGWAAQRVTIDARYDSVTVSHLRRSGNDWAQGGNDMEGFAKVYSITAPPTEMASLLLEFTTRPPLVPNEIGNDEIEARSRVRYRAFYNGEPLFVRRNGFTPIFLDPPNGPRPGYSQADVSPATLEPYPDRMLPSQETVWSTQKAVRARITIYNTGSPGAVVMGRCGYCAPVRFSRMVVRPTSETDFSDATSYGMRSVSLRNLQAVADGRIYTISPVSLSLTPRPCIAWYRHESYGANSYRGQIVTYSGMSRFAGPLMACQFINCTVIADHDYVPDYRYPLPGTANTIGDGLFRSTVRAIEHGGRLVHALNMYDPTPDMRDVLPTNGHAFRGYGIMIKAVNPAQGSFTGTMAITGTLQTGLPGWHEVTPLLASPVRDVPANTEYSIDYHLVRLPKVMWNWTTRPLKYAHQTSFGVDDLYVTQLGALKHSDVGRQQTPDVCCGSVPYNCHIVAQFGGRVWFAGQPDSPGAYYGCRINNIFDWDYGQSDEAAAVAGTLATAGAPAQSITALIPCGDDYMLLCGEGVILVMRGNITAGGSISILSHEVGCLGRLAWCRDDASNVYLMSMRGLMVVPSGAQARPVPLSKARMPRDLVGMTAAGYEPLLVWDSYHGGVWIFAFGRRNRNAQAAWFYDVKTQSFWPMRFPRSWSITSVLSHADMRVGGDRVWIGTSDGFVGVFDPEARTDRYRPIQSAVVYGPIRPSEVGRSGRVDHIDATLTEWSGKARIEVRGADAPEVACEFPLTQLLREDGTPLLREGDGGPYMQEMGGESQRHGESHSVVSDAIEVRRSGPNPRWYPRVRGAFAAVRVSNVDHEPWAVAEMKAGLSDAGRWRPLL